MALSKVNLANLALQKLGGTRISSLSQDHPDARAVSAAYDFVRRKELRAYQWSFSRRRASIAADAATTSWGAHKRYTLPNDFLRLLLDDETEQAVDWQIESADDGTFIITDDTAPLSIRYVADIDDPNYYDALFVEVFVCSLALQCCKEVTGSSSREQDLKDEKRDVIARATQQGAIEKPAVTPPEDEWLTARY